MPKHANPHDPPCTTLEEWRPHLFKNWKGKKTEVDPETIVRSSAKPGRCIEGCQWRGCLLAQQGGSQMVLRSGSKFKIRKTQSKRMGCQGFLQGKHCLSRWFYMVFCQQSRGVCNLSFKPSHWDKCWPQSKCHAPNESVQLQSLPKILNSNSHEARFSTGSSHFDAYFIWVGWGQSVQKRRGPLTPLTTPWFPSPSHPWRPKAMPLQGPKILGQRASQNRSVGQ